MVTRTPSFAFELIDFNKIPWHLRDHANWQLLDAVIAKFISITNIKGVWENSLVVTVGQKYSDAEGSTIWTALVAHTSPATGTFADARTAKPTYWEAFSVDIANAGTWTTATAYDANDFVVDSNRYGIVATGYTSGASYDIDVTAGSIVTLIDLSTDLAAAASSASAAATSATEAAASAASVDITLPSSSTDNTVVRFNGTTGKNLQTSGVLVNDNNLLTAAGGLAFGKGGDLTSASPLVIDTDGGMFDVTGTTNFAAMTVVANRFFILQFDAILTMTHSAGTLDLPYGNNITTAAGDHCLCYSTAENVVRVISYARAAGIAVGDLADATDGELITWDADGVAATVAVGSATHVLTSNGTGAAPTFQAASSVSQAVQSDIEAETNENTYIPPDLLNFNPGIVKGWVAYNHSGPAVLASRNVTSVADNSTGDFTVTWATDFSSTSYAAFVDATNTTYTWGIVHTIAAGTTRCLTGQHSDNSLTDTANSMVLAVGDQA
jgi:hypothetical protein